MNIDLLTFNIYVNCKLLSRNHRNREKTKQKKKHRKGGILMEGKIIN